MNDEITEVLNNKLPNKVTVESLEKEKVEEAAEEAVSKDDKTTDVLEKQDDKTTSDDVSKDDKTTDILKKTDDELSSEDSDVPSAEVLTKAYDIIEKEKRKKRILFIGAGSILAIFLIGIIFVSILSTPGFPDGSSMKLVHAFDVYRLSWDTSKTGKAKEYIVEIYDGTRLEPTEMELKKNKESLLYSDDVLKKEDSASSIAEISLPGGSIKGKKIIIYINSEKKIHLFGKEIVKKGKSPLIAKVAIDEAVDYNIGTDVNIEESSITFTTGKGSPEKYSLYVKKEGTALNTSTDASSGDAESDDVFKLLANGKVDGDNVQAKVVFGTKDFPLPETGETYIFQIKGETVSGPLTYTDLNYNDISMDRNGFLTSSIAVNTTDDGNNRYTFTWNETKGNGYKLSVWSDMEQQWYELKSFGVSDERTYTTEKLKPCIDAKYRIEAISEPGAAELESVQEISIRTKPSIQYATVWPTMELPVYKNSIGDEQVGTVSLLHGMTVLDESDGRFHVRTGMGDNAEEGYIEAIKCLVNLPDYMGDLCKYDITNSYSSGLTAHDYAIPELSGTTVSGYENVLLSDGSFLVPVLYPVAQSLARAGERAREQGYKLKIYDAYRPAASSSSIYELTNAAMDYVLPGSTFSNVSLKDYMDGTRAGVVSLSELKNSKEEKKKSKKSKKKDEKTTTEAANDNIYSKAILGKGEYKLDDFIEQGASAHSYGTALDVSLVRLDNMEELSMQSHIHDLSINSTQGSNNENANMLRDIMTSEGFSAATTEWWHFQDNNPRDELGAVSVQEGVSVEGWKKDDRGWRYRQANGNYYVDTTETIGVKTFTFDKDGYTDIK